jgi:hypothetical protein
LLAYVALLYVPGATTAIGAPVAGAPPLPSNKGFASFPPRPPFRRQQQHQNRPTTSSAGPRKAACRGVMHVFNLELWWSVTVAWAHQPTITNPRDRATFEHISHHALILAATHAMSDDGGDTQDGTRDEGGGSALSPAPRPRPHHAGSNGKCMTQLSKMTLTLSTGRYQSQATPMTKQFSSAAAPTSLTV